MKRILKSINLLATVLGIALFILSSQHQADANFCTGGCPEICPQGSLCQGCNNPDHRTCSVWYGPQYDAGDGGTAS
jgi:hypothetical protein